MNSGYFKCLEVGHIFDKEDEGKNCKFCKRCNMLVATKDTPEPVRIFELGIIPSKEDFERTEECT